MDIIDTAIAEHNPSHVFALFSGGDDSVSAANLISKHPRFTACVLIDTGIALAEAHEHARDVCKAQGWPLLVYKSKYHYADIVRKHGFPGPSAHRYMYILLKERAVRALVREHKQGPRDRIMLVTGVRKSESARRMETVKDAVQRSGAALWVAPMWDWSRDERDLYQDTNNLPHNPVKDKLHVSGDCLCGAYAHKGDMASLEIFYPEAANRIKALQKIVTKYHPWNWEEEPPKWISQYRAGQKFLGDGFMPLCWACENNNALPVNE